MRTGTGLSAVITTYRPDAGFIARFTALLGPCDQVFVVDNTPGGFRFGPCPAGFSVLQDGTNRGLGPALNRGISLAQAAGADYVILFDQDSSPTADTVRQLLSACRDAQGRLGTPCAVGPMHVDDGSGSALTRRQGRARAEFQEVSCLLTSGLLLPLKTIGADPSFASDLFLDLVDFEWCWRQGRQGWRFVRANHVVLLHRPGIEERRWLGLRFHVPAPYRHYFQFRDALRLATRHYVPLYSRLRLLAVLPVKLLLYPLILDRGAERLRWMIRGVADAIRGVVGIGAAARRLAR